VRLVKIIVSHAWVIEKILLYVTIQSDFFRIIFQSIVQSAIINVRNALDKLQIVLYVKVIAFNNFLAFVLTSFMMILFFQNACSVIYYVRHVI